MSALENKHIHLQMIQGVINRLSNNSFLLKGWSVVIVSGLFALAAANNRLLFILLAALPALAFWVLDAYFLRQERLFRRLYDHVRGLSHEKVDYSMSTAHFNGVVPQTPIMMLSRTLIIFHGAIVAVIVAIAIYSTRANEPIVLRKATEAALLPAPAPAHMAGN